MSHGKVIIHDENGRIAATTKSVLSPPTEISACPGKKKRNKIINALRGNICTFFNCAASIGSHNARNFSLFKHTDGDIP